VLGKVRLANIPFRFIRLRRDPRTVAPLLGQHNREVAAKLGFSEAEIDAMVKDGVLYAEDPVVRLAAA
jgi:crotonobetainyl-CoA:carnitine CoA-transferase CaiB-like acyl-CoA transferase